MVSRADTQVSEHSPKKEGHEKLSQKREGFAPILFEVTHASGKMPYQVLAN